MDIAGPEPRPPAHDHATMLRQTMTAYRVLVAVLRVIRDTPGDCECRLMAEHALAEAERVRSEG